MTTVFAVDASVFVASCRPREPGHLASVDFMGALLDADVLLVEPAILPVEVGGALHRAGMDAESAREYAESLFEQPYLTLVATDERMARRALSLAIQCRLREADALYLAAAAQFGARLVTLDAEQLERAPKSVRACKPDAATRLLKKANDTDIADSVRSE